MLVASFGGVLNTQAKAKRLNPMQQEEEFPEMVALQGLLLDGFIVCIRDAEMVVSEWIEYLVTKDMPTLLVDCLRTGGLSLHVLSTIQTQGFTQEIVSCCLHL